MKVVMPADAHAAVKVSPAVICREQHAGQKVSESTRKGRWLFDKVGACLPEKT
jgi:hypothetical protein